MKCLWMLITLMAITGFHCSCVAKNKKKAGEYSFDGFKIGARYSAAISGKAPYLKHCDDDPIDGKKARFMVFGALPCRKMTFPQQTTVMFYLHFAEDAALDQTIKAFGYMGGDYYKTRSDFPLSPGEPFVKAVTIFGPEKTSFLLKRKKFQLTVHSFPGDIYVLEHEQVIVGLVLGAMPDSAENEQWRGLMQMYHRYTPKPKVHLTCKQDEDCTWVSYYADGNGKWCSGCKFTAVSTKWRELMMSIGIPLGDEGCPVKKCPGPAQVICSDGKCVFKK